MSNTGASGRSLPPATLVSLRLAIGFARSTCRSTWTAMKILKSQKKRPYNHRTSGANNAN